MDAQAAKYIGAGLAVFALFGVAIGVGNIFATLMSSIARNPSCEKQIRPIGLLGFAMTEAVGIFALLVAFMILLT